MGGTASGPALVKLPESHKGQAVNINPHPAAHYRMPPGQAGPHGGRGCGLLLGPASSAAVLSFDGPQDSMAVRKGDDTDLALEISYRKVEVGTTLALWCVGLDADVHRDWACRFCFSADGTLSPADKPNLTSGKGPSPSGLVVGVNAKSELVLVKRSDKARCLVFESGKELAAHVDAIGASKAAAAAGASKERALILKSPACDWMGDAPKAIVLRGSAYMVGKDGSRGYGIGIGVAGKACIFQFDGVAGDAMSLRKFDDPDLALEVNWRKNEPGNPLSMWYSGGEAGKGRGAACKFTMGPDRTLSPFGAKGVVLGAKQGTAELILVGASDPLRLIFQSEKEMDEQTDAIRSEQKATAAARVAMKAEAAERCNADMFRCLRTDGFVHLKDAVPQKLVRKARQEINRELGSSSQSADAFKAKSFPDRAEITDLFNASMVPFILRHLLGPLGQDREYHQDRGQLALRFPGDMCHDGTCECDFGTFENVRRAWHIDGCPSNFLPGVSDHWGKIMNFDALVGILLSDIPETMSGELCCYPGSHTLLAQYFKKHGLDDVYKKGNAALPTGTRTDELLGRKPAHCIGRAGDVFIANYMTAHFIAPNTAPDIRYAVYFRVRGPALEREHTQASMLDPLMHWRLSAAAAEAPAEEPAPLHRAASLEDVLQESRIHSHYAAANNDHTSFRAARK